MKHPERSGVIYSIVCAANGKTYIGSTMRKAKQRWHEHLHFLRRGKHCSPYLQHCFTKYGEASLAFEIVEAVVDANFLLPREQFHIWRHEHHSLNSQPVADSVYAARAANVGRVQDEEERAMRSAAIRQAIESGTTQYSPWTEERRKAHGVALTGRAMPPAKPDRGRKISEAKKGKPASKAATANSVATRTAFIAEEVYAWLAMRERGISFREIERITGRCRKVVGRECKKVIGNDADKGASEPITG